ncbi:MAG: hypothetical protein ACOYM9_04300 [Bradymonadia bacterium]|jgi:hypothetical protein
MNAARAALIACGLVSAAGVLWASPAHATEKVAKKVTAGTPAPVSGPSPYFWLFHDDAGWHLRWSGPAGDKKRVFTGLVQVTGARISTVKPAGMTGGDDSVGRLDQARAMFKSESAGTVEGIDFKVGEGAGSLYLELFVDYDVIGPSSIRLGASGAQPVDVTPALQIDLQASP